MKNQFARSTHSQCRPNLIKQIIRIFRVSSWSYLLGIPLLASVQFLNVDYIKHALVVFYASTYLGWGYLYNNYFDQEEDVHSKNAFKKITSSKRKISIVLGATLFFVVLSSFLHLLQEAAILITLNSVYSIPNIRLKRFLLPSLFLNGIFFSYLYYLALRILEIPTLPLKDPLLFYIFFLFIIFQYIHHLEHLEIKNKKFSKKSVFLSFFPVIIYLLSLQYPYRDGDLMLTLIFMTGTLIATFKVSSAIYLRKIVRVLGALLGFGMILMRLCF